MVGTTVELKNVSAVMGGACTVIEWRVEFDSNQPMGWWSTWSSQLYAGQTQSQNLSQQGFDDRDGQKMRVAAYVAGHMGIIHSSWVTYAVGQQYSFSLVGPSGSPGINGPE
jgi:hypothetical protein